MPDAAYAAARARIKDLRARAGRTGAFTFSYSCGATRVLDRPGTPKAPPPGARPPAGSEFSYAPAPWLADDGRPRLVGTPDQLISDLRLLQAAGVDHVTLRFGSTDVGQLERFSAEVRPAFDVPSG
jgi:alkanesulfonate monooxygenase SsuD/methylene tetrahydromethanopterin reductase-like flavin-dependent oxidoreductase (luciferase family)